QQRLPKARYVGSQTNAWYESGFPDFPDQKSHRQSPCTENRVPENQQPEEWGKPQPGRVGFAENSGVRPIWNSVQNNPLRACASTDHKFQEVLPSTVAGNPAEAWFHTF